MKMVDAVGVLLLQLLQLLLLLRLLLPLLRRYSRLMRIIWPEHGKRALPPPTGQIVCAIFKRGGMLQEVARLVVSATKCYNFICV